MTDDQGYGDLSCHGNPVVRTPHLDAVHDASVRFDDFHVAPMCTPTRGQLLTGVDAARNGAINVSAGRTMLKAGFPTIADAFRAAGYRTGLFGKWHLGDNCPSRPFDRGFDDCLWFPSSHLNSVPDWWNNDYFDDTLRRNDRLERHEGYCTDVFFREAIAWMGQQREEGRPFFCYLPTNAPHSPHWVPSEYREAVEGRMAEAEDRGDVPTLPADQRRELVRFLAMIENIDANVGGLDGFLRESGLFDDTILLFLTDNGSTFGHAYFPAGMRGGKTELWEGGHRVPLFARWPGGGLGEPRDVGGLAQAQDVMPTLLDLCDVAPPDGWRGDGVSLASTLRGEAALPEDRTLVINYSRMPVGLDYPTPDAPSMLRKEGAAVLWKRWRLLEGQSLYDLDADPMQRRDVAAAHPEVVGRLRRHLDNWWDEVKDTANEPQAVILGSAAENPSLLSACEWRDVFLDQQQQVLRGDPKNSFWLVDVATAGTFTVELRRWPREAKRPVAAGCEPAELHDGQAGPGRALPIASARLHAGGKRLAQPVGPSDEKATFEVELPAGKQHLYTWFDDADGRPLLGAYYVYVERISVDDSTGSRMSGNPADAATARVA